MTSSTDEVGSDVELSRTRDGVDGLCLGVPVVAADEFK